MHDFTNVRTKQLHTLLATLTLAGYPTLAALAAAFDVTSAPIAVAMRAVIAGCSIILLALAARGRIRIAKGTIWVAISVFWVAYLGRILVETVLIGANLSREPLEYWVWAIGACLLPMMAMMTCPAHRFTMAAYWSSLVLLFVAAVIIANLGSASSVTIDGREVDIGRLNIQTLNPISLGHLGCSLLLLAIWPMLRSLTRWRQATAIAVFAGGLGIYLVAAAASRGPLVSLALVVLFYLLSSRQRALTRSVPVVATVILVLVYGAEYLQHQGEFRLLDRVLVTLGGDDRAITSRQVAFHGAMNQFATHPVVGDGLEERVTGFYPHNIILESFMATGLVGGIAFLAMMAYGLRIAYQALRSKSADGWVTIIFLQYFFAAQFSGAIYSATVLWAYFGLSLALFRSGSFGQRRAVFRP